MTQRSLIKLVIVNDAIIDLNNDSIKSFVKINSTKTKMNAEIYCFFNDSTN